MKTPVSNSKSADLQKTQQALIRASEKARLLAEQTGTPFITRSVTPEPVAISANKLTLPPVNTTQH